MTTARQATDQMQKARVEFGLLLYILSDAYDYDTASLKDAEDEAEAVIREYLTTGAVKPRS